MKPRFHARACHVCLALLVIVIATTPARAQDSPLSARLKWKNGDVLPGRLLDMDGARLRWQSPFFVSPLSIHLDSLDSARLLGPETSTKTDEPYRFTLRSGDVLYGQLVDLTEDRVVVKSQRHGECRIVRALLLEIRRLDRAESAAQKEPYVGRSRVRLQGEAHYLYGQVRHLDSSTGMLVVDGFSGVRYDVELDEVVSIYMDEDDTIAVSGKPRIQVTYHDGTRLQGTAGTSERGGFLLETAYADQAIVCPLNGIGELKFLRDKKPPRDGGDERLLMELESGRLHVLPATSESDAVLSWRLVGSTHASLLAPGVAAHVTFDAGKKERPPRLDGFSDILHLRNGDVTACKLLSVDQSHLRVHPAFGEERAIPRSAVKAVEFNSRLRLPVAGFADPGWTDVGQGQSQLERTDDKVVFRGSATLRHADILHGNELSFDMRWKTGHQANLTLSLFSRGADGRQPTVMLYLLGGQLMVRTLRREGRLFHMVGMQPRRVRDGRASIRIVIEGDALQIFVDDNLVGQEPFPQKDRAGAGIVMTVQAPRVRARGVIQKSPLELTISNFEIGWSGDGVRQMSIDEEKKKLVLTVPRQRKKNPPTHVLVARNRDLLRGRLTAVNRQGVHFISRMDDLTVPRERLAGIIWLDGISDPEEAKTPSRPDDRGSEGTARAVRAVLRDGTTLTFIPERVENGEIVGRSELFGVCRIPLDHLHELDLGGHGGDRTLAYADWKLVPAKEPKFATPPAAGSRSPATGLDSPLVGQAAGRIDAELLGGGKFRLGDHAGKVVIVDFWATWCGPCVRAMPQIMRVAESFPRDKVVLVAVNQQQPPAIVREFLKRRGWELEVALDRDGSVGRRYQVDAIPQTVVIGKSGKVEWLHVGAHPDLEKSLGEILRKLTAREPSEN